jgi:hypothetical protein
MAWSNIIEDTGIGENAKTAYRALKNKEYAHVTVERTDAGSTDPMLIQVWDSIDMVTDNDVPLFEVLMQAADDKIGFSVTGVYSFAVGLGSIGSTDTVVATFKMRFDGGLTP